MDGGHLEWRGTVGEIQELALLTLKMFGYTCRHLSESLHWALTSIISFIAEIACRCSVSHFWQFL